MIDERFLNEFHNGFRSDAYEFLGSFYGEEATLFRVYAPHADSVGVVGDFNRWDKTKNVMKKVDERGIWETSIPGIAIFDNYKYLIRYRNREFLKQDPYGHHNETEGRSASKIYDLEGYEWNDGQWMKDRNDCDLYRSPINIYEVHLGSWMRKQDNIVYNYREIAPKLIAYAKKMGYTHIELLPLMEHPYAGSWGYQLTGYYGITSRYGTPKDFMYLVDTAHRNGIGIIMDWVPAHFSKDDFGLYEFDGECLYEDPSPTRKEHEAWGTRIFNYAKPEVKSFLISGACFLFDKFHIDGIRCDAVAAMIYLDYDRKEWEPNIYGGNYNLEAIAFLKDLNRTCFRRFGNIMMIAEESTSFPKVTYPVDEGGLGFNFKWNMGWMNDSLSYISTDPLYRRYCHHRMTFGMSYAGSENFILPLSHDEFVHGKKSLLDKMPGDYDDKFANLRVYLGYMMTHPGKKLLFMGSEFGQFIEWDENKELDWLLLGYPRHRELQRYVRDLNRFYRKRSPLFESERDWHGFEWIYPDNDKTDTYAYFRRDEKGRELIVVLNFSGEDYGDFPVKHRSLEGEYRIVFRSDESKYGGTDKCTSPIIIHAEDGLFRIALPRLSMVIMQGKLRKQPGKGERKC